MKIKAGYIIVIIFLFSCILQAEASKLDQDVSQSMYFRRSAYSEHDAQFGKFKEEMKLREQARNRQIREERLRKRLAEQVFAENETFKDVKVEMGMIERGSTGLRDVLEIPGMPAYLINPANRWKRMSWNLHDYFHYGSYPLPGDVQKVLAGRYYYTTISPPKNGISLDLLVTVNKYTKRVDYAYGFLDNARIMPYWMVP